MTKGCGLICPAGLSLRPHAQPLSGLSLLCLGHGGPCRRAGCGFPWRDPTIGSGLELPAQGDANALRRAGLLDVHRWCFLERSSRGGSRGSGVCRFPGTWVSVSSIGLGWGPLLGATARPRLPETLAAQWALCPLLGLENQVVSEGGGHVWVSGHCQLLTFSHSRERQHLAGPRARWLLRGCILARISGSCHRTSDHRVEGPGSSPSLGSLRTPSRVSEQLPCALGLVDSRQTGSGPNTGVPGASSSEPVLV